MLVWSELVLSSEILPPVSGQAKHQSEQTNIRGRIYQHQDTGSAKGNHCRGEEDANDRRKDAQDPDFRFH